MDKNKEPMDESVMQSADKLGLLTDTDFDYIFFLPVASVSNEDIEEIKSKAELAGFFFNGFEEFKGEAAIKFVYNKSSV